MGDLPSAFAGEGDEGSVIGDTVVGDLGVGRNGAHSHLVELRDTG